MISIVSHFTDIPNKTINFKFSFNTRHLVIVSNPKITKFYMQVIFWPTEYTQIYNLAHYEKRLDILVLVQLYFNVFYFYLLNCVDELIKNLNV